MAIRPPVRNGLEPIFRIKPEVTRAPRPSNPGHAPHVAASGSPATAAAAFSAHQAHLTRGPVHFPASTPNSDEPLRDLLQGLMLLSPDQAVIILEVLAALTRTELD